MKKIGAGLLMVAVIATANPVYAASDDVKSMLLSLIDPLETLVEALSEYFGFSDETQIAQLTQATIATERSNRKAVGFFGTEETSFPGNGRAVFEGELQVTVFDDFENQRAEYFYELYDEVTDRVLLLKPDGELPPGLEAGAMLRARGVVSNGEMEISAGAEAGSDGSVEVLAEAIDSISGSTQNRTVAAILLNWTDVANPCTPAQIESNLFAETNSVKKAYESASHGELSFSGDVFGPFDISYASTDGRQQVGWMNEAADILAAQGVDIYSYNHQMLFMPKPIDGGWGYAAVNGSRGVTLKCDSRDIVQHELGHNLGMLHAGQGTNEYADTSSFMGYSNVGLRHTHAGHMDNLNWLPDAAVISNPPAGTYTLSSSDKYPGDLKYPQALRIAKPDTNEFYYISYRTPSGYANNMPARYDNTTQIHKVSSINSVTTTLVQTLADGAEFSDPTNGISIRQISSILGESTTVEVSTACTALPPTVDITPAEVGSTPGGTAQYTVNVRNNNGAFCGDASISLSSSDTSESLSTSLSTSAVTLASGASANMTLTAQSDSTIGSGSVTLTVSAATPGTSNGGSDTALYTIDATAPSVPTNVAAAPNRKQVNVSWNAATDNISVVGYRVYRNGAEISTTPNTSFADKFPVSGTNSYQIQAYDAAGNESALSTAVATDFKSGGGGKGGKGGKNTGGSDGDTTDGGDSGKPEKCSPWPNCR